MTRILALLGTMLAMLAVTLVAAPAAHAASTNCAFYGTGISSGVRNGQFCATVGGSGTNVDRITGNFGASWPGRDQVCNPSIKMDVYDKWGNWITWRQGDQTPGCFWGTWNAVKPINVYWSFPQAAGGYVKVTLQHYGGDRASTHHRLG